LLNPLEGGNANPNGLRQLLEFERQMKAAERKELEDQRKREKEARRHERAQARELERQKLRAEAERREAEALQRYQEQQKLVQQRLMEQEEAQRQKVELEALSKAHMATLVLPNTGSSSATDEPMEFEPTESAKVSWKKGLPQRELEKKLPAKVKGSRSKTKTKASSKALPLKAPPPVADALANAPPQAGLVTNVPLTNTNPVNSMLPSAAPHQQLGAETSYAGAFMNAAAATAAATASSIIRAVKSTSPMRPEQSSGLHVAEHERRGGLSAAPLSSLQRAAAGTRVAAAPPAAAPPAAARLVMDIRSVSPRPTTRSMTAMAASSDSVSEYDVPLPGVATWMARGGRYDDTSSSASDSSLDSINFDNDDDALQEVDSSTFDNKNEPL
jgi:hypothetical protein